MTTTAPNPLAEVAGPRLAPPPGLPPRQGTVLAVLWEAPRPLTAAQISTHLPTTGISHASASCARPGWSLPPARATPIVTRRCWAAMTTFAGLVAAALDQAGDPAAVLRTALHTPAQP